MSTNSATLYPPSPYPPSLAPPSRELVSVTSNSVLHNETNFLWTEQRIRACTLLADGRYTIEEIAQIVGTSIQILTKWKANSIFSDKLQALLNEFQDKVLATSIALKTNRLQALQRRHRSLESIVLQRTQQTDPSSPFHNPYFSTVPG